MFEMSVVLLFIWTVIQALSLFILWHLPPIYWGITKAPYLAIIIYTALSTSYHLWRIRLVLTGTFAAVDSDGKSFIGTLFKIVFIGKIFAFRLAIETVVYLVARYV